MKLKNGFSLIELMIVVTIMGVLTSIAFPMYSDYVTRAKVTEGISALANMRIKMEQYFQDNRSYEGACEDGTMAEIPSNLLHFTISCSNLTGDTYQITAEGVGFTYTLSQANERATTAAPEGWPTDESCWVINKNGSCQ